jgi:3-oxoacyl-[acyl-carrier protein] reductase
MTMAANPMSLAGRTIVVTGAAQGIGRAVSELVIGLGGRVVLVDLSAERLAETTKALGETHCLAQTGNITEPGFASAVVERSIERFGAVDGLVNNAGITRPAMIEKMTLSQWQQVIDVHLTGSFLFLQTIGSHMIERSKAGGGHPGAIVNVSSDAGVQGTIGQINYSAAKCGILGATMSAAREWAKYGIRVNAVSFGVVETPMTEVVRGEKFRDKYLAKIPLGRWSTAQEAANPICFLLSEASSFVTGQNLCANGGSQMSA